MTYVLKQETDNYEVDVRFVQNYSSPKETPVTPLPIPGKGAKDSLLLAFSGEQQTIVINLLLFNTGSRIDRNTAPSATFPSGVISINDQMIWWNEFIKKPDLGTKWTFTGPGLPSGGSEVFLSNINVVRDVNRPLEVGLEIQLRVGSVL
jgi:hypothetical protein